MPVGDKPISAPQKVTIVTFRLGSQVYALPIAPVRQIIEMVTITPLPQVSPNVVGVINFHGVIAPVINLRGHLGLADFPLKLHTPIILVTVSEHLVGLIVDQVLDVVEVAADQVIDPRDILTKDMGEAAILNGLIHLQEGTILLLDVDQLLKSQPTAALLEVSDAITQSKEPDSSSKETVSRKEEAPQVQNPEKDLPNETKPPPTKKPKARSRKKAGDAPIIVNEVTA